MFFFTLTRWNQMKKTLMFQPSIVYACSNIKHYIFKPYQSEEHLLWLRCAAFVKCWGCFDGSWKFKDTHARGTLPILPCHCHVSPPKWSEWLERGRAHSSIWSLQRSWPSHLHVLCIPAPCKSFPPRFCT